MRCISHACSSDNDFYTCVRAPNSILVVCVTPALSNNLRNTQTHERNHRIHHASHVVAVDKFDLIVRNRFFSQIPDGFTDTANSTHKFTALSRDNTRIVYRVVADPLFLLRPNENNNFGNICNSLLVKRFVYAFCPCRSYSATTVPEFFE